MFHHQTDLPLLATDHADPPSFIFPAKSVLAHGHQGLDSDVQLFQIIFLNGCCIFKT